MQLMLKIELLYWHICVYVCMFQFFLFTSSVHLSFLIVCVCVFVCVSHLGQLNHGVECICVSNQLFLHLSIQSEEGQSLTRPPHVLVLGGVNKEPVGKSTCSLTHYPVA